MNSVIATTKSSIYLAIKHVFPDVPINAGSFEPLHDRRSRRDVPLRAATRGRSRAAPPRSASASPRRCSPRSVKAIPDQLFARAGGHLRQPGARRLRPAEAASAYVMYVISGGGYGGSADGDGLSNGCSTIGISKTHADRGAGAATTRCCSRSTRCTKARAAPGEHRGGFGVNYTIRLRRGEARASIVMDHGRFGPPGALGGQRRRRQRGARSSAAGRRLRAAAPVEGPGHPPRRGRRHRGVDAGRRRLRRSVPARAGAAWRATSRAATTPARKRDGYGVALSEDGSVDPAGTARLRATTGLSAVGACLAARFSLTLAPAPQALMTRGLRHRAAMQEPGPTHSRTARSDPAPRGAR